MPDRKKRESRLERSRRRQQAAAQEATAREQANRPPVGPETGTLTEEEVKKQTITLEDGSILEAYQAAHMWLGLRDVLPPEERAELLQSLLALAQGRPDQADPQHFETLRAYTLVGDDNSIDPLARAVLLNGYAFEGGTPVIVPLRLKSEADRPVAEAALALRYQEVEETGARARLPGGMLDRLRDQIRRSRGQGEGRSPE